MQQPLHEGLDKCIVLLFLTSYPALCNLVRIPSGGSSVYAEQRAHYGSVRGVASAPGDPTCIATCSDDGTVATWSLAHPQAPPLTQIHVAKSDLPGSGAALSVALTGDTVISGWADGMIRGHARGGSSAPSWSIPGAHALGNSVGVTAIKMANRSGFMITGGAGGEVRAWDMRTRQMSANLKAHSAAIVDLAVLADDAHVIAASLDRSWSLWWVSHPDPSPCIHGLHP